MRHTVFTFVAAMIVVMLGMRTLGAQPTLPASQIIVRDDPTLLTLTGKGRSNAAANIVNVTGEPFAKAWRVQVRQRVNRDWDLQFICKPDAAFKVGDVVLLTAYARTISTADESGKGRLTFALERVKASFDKVFDPIFDVGREWQRFDVPTVIDRDFKTNGVQFAIAVGSSVQTLEIGGFEVRQFAKGTDLNSLPWTRVSYAGRAGDAPWRKAAAERIEKIRKAPIVVTVIDASGNPVANADVHVRMTRHAFAFGSCYRPRVLVNDALPDVQKYRQTFLKLFNTGVDEYAMKWPSWDYPPAQQKALESLKWMRDHGIVVRGHNMVWPSWKHLPPKVKAIAGDPDALRQMIRRHILNVGGAMRGRVIGWDVVNEPYANKDLMKILGEDVIADWFKTAREADPTARLYLNEASVPNSPPSDPRYTALYNLVSHLQKLGAPIGGIGMQAHFGSNVRPPVQLLGIYDRFAALGLPVRITEFDINTDDEQLQADYFRDFLTASFSHPNINGILLWGFWEGADWRPKAAMFRRDWSPRPIAGVWENLVLKQWWTDQHLSTSDAGTIKVRGFLGDYDITAAVGARTVTAKAVLSSAGASVRLTLPD